jgi:hypothetical protein
MKTYEETIMKLAMDSARTVRNGGPNNYPDGINVVAFIYGVTAEAVKAALDLMEDEAWAATAK